MRENHFPCADQNNHYGAWCKKPAPSGFPYSWFFDYYQLDALDPKTGDRLGVIYYDRGNKLDGLFGWICERLYTLKDEQSRLRFGRKIKEFFGL